jgi:hypothetical protein
VPAAIGPVIGDIHDRGEPVEDLPVARCDGGQRLPVQDGNDPDTVTTTRHRDLLSAFVSDATSFLPAETQI